MWTIVRDAAGTRNTTHPPRVASWQWSDWRCGATTMNLLEAIRERHTTNSQFRPDPVKPEHIKLLIEAAARCPSHFNSQPWRFVLIRDEEQREALAELAGASMKEFVTTPPAKAGGFFQSHRPPQRLLR